MTALSLGDVFLPKLLQTYTALHFGRFLADLERVQDDGGYGRVGGQQRGRGLSDVNAYCGDTARDYDDAKYDHEDEQHGAELVHGRRRRCWGVAQKQQKTEVQL